MDDGIICVYIVSTTQIGDNMGSYYIMFVKYILVFKYLLIVYPVADCILSEKYTAMED